jgi:hypothetical protein
LNDARRDAGCSYFCWGSVHRVFCSSCSETELCRLV